MNTSPISASNPLSLEMMAERRNKPRISEPFSMKVRGVDASGEAFEIDTTLDNISAGGLHFRMRRRVAQGARLFLIVGLTTTPGDEKGALRVAARGEVRRVEKQSYDLWGVAVAFARHRLL